MSLSVNPTVPSPSQPKYPGVYPAKVFATNDPQGTGRVMMYIPQIFGTHPVQVWAPPLVAGSVPPPVGTVVWCMFQGGDPSYPTYLPPPSAAISTITIASGVAFTPSATATSSVYIQFNAAGGTTNYSITLGPTGTEGVIASNLAMGNNVDQLVHVRVPVPGWKVVVTWVNVTIGHVTVVTE